MFGEEKLSKDKGDNLVNIDIKEDKNKNKEIEMIIADLNLYNDNVQMLTKKYTELLLDDNVIDIFTKLSHDKIFIEHFPEFYVKNKYGESVINCQQNNRYHKYGVFRHTLYTVEVVGKENIQRSNREMKLLKWTMLLHDIGKPYIKTIDAQGNDSFAGHDDLSVETSKKILDRFDFSEEDKKIILTLIKYHDRYLNEGELTFDNLSFLAGELDNKKDLFYLLIDVKIADSRAKTIEVYNKFTTIIQKYYDFAAYYFNNRNKSSEEFESQKDNLMNEFMQDDTETGSNLSGIQNILEEINEKDFKEIYEKLLEKKITYPVYQPIVDIEKNSIYGYESFNKIKYDKNVNILDFIKKSKDYSKFDKVQQLLFINSIENFQSTKTEKNKKVFVQIDVNSYIKYINKPRLYDLMDKNKIIIEFTGYDKIPLSELQKTIKQIRSKGAKVLLNDFGTNKFKINDLNNIDVDYIKYDTTLLSSFEENEENKKHLSELSTYCLSRDIELIVIGIENIEQLQIVLGMGIKLVQGYVFGKPEKEIENSLKRVKEVKSIIEKDESIV
ncbi:MAG: EAL domain-containing protein [Clostridia bacterium]|nr:EAL domain-containing protein [Clostridia bacterium]MDD4376018.1 EAL domain-containing protein [Clostridia bacterium]